jgi:hypothetical protein
MAAIIAAKSTFRSRTFSTPTPGYASYLVLCLGAFRSSLAAGKDGLFECATYRGKFMRRTRAWKRGSERKSSQPGYLFV